MKRILITEVSAASRKAIEPLLTRAPIKIGRISSAREAMAILRHHQLDGLVVGFPLDGLRFAELLASVRHPDSASRQCRILVAVDRELRGRLSPYLGDAGIDSVVSPEDEPLLLQHEVSALLGVARRAAVRLMIRVQEQVRSGTGRSLLGQSVDLSVSGVLVETDEQLPVGTQVTLKMFLPEHGQTVSGWGDVVRLANAERDPCRGFAVRFAELDGDSAALLEHLFEGD